ncbi:hypothetical protein DPMN_013974 [Dreissena polymorpha]|uniref:Uncharacterized protein n=1 Tax=Dreissena polymorpha TaxID=45954 RepID=A0A9D4S4T3_DREPO|nr:hypothetical protein DPMN_013974 [Dreissena polymorpha]
MADNNDQSDSEVDFNVNENGRGEGQEYQWANLTRHMVALTDVDRVQTLNQTLILEISIGTSTSHTSKIVQSMHNGTKRRSYFTLLQPLSSRHACIKVRYLLLKTVIQTPDKRIRTEVWKQTATRQIAFKDAKQNEG